MWTKGVERGILKAGGVALGFLVPPPGQTWGLAPTGSAHSPAPPTAARGGRAQRGGPGCCSAGDCSVWHHLPVSLPIACVLCLSPSSACPSLALASPLHHFSGWGWGSWPTRGGLFSACASRFPARVGVGPACLAPLPLCLFIPVSVLSCPWLAHPIRPSSVPDSVRLLPPFPHPHFAPLLFSRTLYPSPRQAPRPLGSRAAPYSRGGGSGKECPVHLAPARPPPPHKPGFIKQTGPYIARPGGPGSPRPPYMARRLRTAPGRRWEGGVPRWDRSWPSTRPPLAPSSSPGIPRPGFRSQFPLPRCETLGKATLNLSALLCQMGLGALTGAFWWAGDFKFNAPERLTPFRCGWERATPGS